MKSSEIKVGTDYAYRSSSYSSPSRVRVLETGVARTEGDWSFNKRTVKNGVRVALLADDGTERDKEFVATSRQIEQEWATYAEEKRRREQYRREAEETKVRTYAERARQAKALDTYLGDHGQPAKPVPLYGPEVEAALVAAGFEVTTDGEGFRRTREVHTRVTSIRDFVAKGTVSLTDLGPVFADLEIRQEVSA